jgi:hypothetical protein
VALAACISVLSVDDVDYFPTSDGGSDARGPDEAGDGDAAPQGECTDEMPFRDKGMLPSPLNEARTSWLRETPDGREAYFAIYTTDRNWDIYSARVSDGGFTSVAEVQGVNSPLMDYAPSVSGDGLRLVYGSNGAGGYQLMMATRRDGAAPFDNPVVLDAGVPRPTDPYYVTNAAGQDVLYFDSYGTIYRMVVAPTPSAPRIALSVTGAAAFAPLVTFDEMTLFVERDTPIPGDAGLIARCICWVRRSSVAVPFQEEGLRPIGELTTDAAEYATWISRDRCTLYFTRDLVNPQVFMASRR